MKIKQTSRLTQLTARAFLVVIIAFSAVGLVGVGGESASAAKNFCRTKYPIPLGGSQSAAERASEQRGACQVGYDTQKCNAIKAGDFTTKAELRTICQKGVVQSKKDGVKPPSGDDTEDEDPSTPPSGGSSEPGKCPDNVLTFPTWYRGLQDPATCDIESPGSGETALGDFIWKIVLNVIEIALQLVGYLAVGFIIYGGFVYITGAGSPDKITAGRKIILNAVIGLVISIFSIAIVNLVLRGFE